MPTKSALTALAAPQPDRFRDADLAAFAAQLRASAPADLCDPAFRAALRAELTGERPAYQYGQIATPLGSIWVAFAGTALHLLSAKDEAAFVAEAQREIGVAPARVDPMPERIAHLVLAALTGRKLKSDLRGLERLTPFQRSVLEQARRIPRGEVRSYAWIAREIGHPNAVRAVGTALARNPLPFVIPCHRVIRSDGDLGRYSGGGTDTKARVLAFEGVNLDRLQAMARDGLRFRGSRNTKIFCLPTCYSQKHSQERHTVYFHSEGEARAAGYRPCKLCKPAV